MLLVTLPIPWVAKLIWPHRIKWVEVGITLVASTAVILIMWFSGTAGMIHDREIWNGEITNKTRTHGHYLRPYSCRCRNVCSGSGSSRTCSQHCDTCYENRYTVSWVAHSNIENFTIQHLDSSWRSVYNTPDPGRYTQIKIGDPCSISKSFVNYVKAVPESLFHANPLLVQKYKNMIPAYPGKIYDYYKVNRVLAVGFNLPEADTWQLALANTLRKLGPQKQLNAIVVFVKGADPDYQQQLEASWIGGKKNDVIIIVGVNTWPNIDWVAVSSWSKSELFKVQLRDDIKALNTIDQMKMMSLLETHAFKGFQRRNMEEFAYLKDEIDPPDWVIILAVILSILVSLGASYYFYKHDPICGKLGKY